MVGPAMRVIELEEEESRLVPATALTEAQALELHGHFTKAFEVSFPGPLLGQQYRLRGRGYVGWFPLSDFQVHVHPKVFVQNLFGMLAWAYGFRELPLWDEGIKAKTVDGLFELLVSTLAQRVIDRIHRGLWSDFVEREELLGGVRGRVLVEPMLRSAGPSLRCRFAEQTADLIDNRILIWTLFALRRYPFRRKQVRRLVHRAFFMLVGTVSLVPVKPEQCTARSYHRLNQDYQPLHALCRLFLEQVGPALGQGERDFVGFAVHMPTLFENFVAQWLRVHLPSQWELDIQHRVPLEGSDRLTFQIDLALREKSTGKHLAVLDTKYKREPEPDERDIQQVVAYAVRMGTARAILIYPHKGMRTRFLRVGSVAVEVRAFDLGGDLERAGKELVEELEEEEMSINTHKN